MTPLRVVLSMIKAEQLGLFDRVIHVGAHARDGHPVAGHERHIQSPPTSAESAGAHASTGHFEKLRAAAASEAGHLEARRAALAAEHSHWRAREVHLVDNYQLSREHFEISMKHGDDAVRHDRLAGEASGGGLAYWKRRDEALGDAMYHTGRQLLFRWGTHGAGWVSIVASGWQDRNGFGLSRRRGSAR